MHYIQMLFKVRKWNLETKKVGKKKIGNFFLRKIGIFLMKIWKEKAYFWELKCKKKSKNIHEIVESKINRIQRKVSAKYSRGNSKQTK